MLDIEKVMKRAERYCTEGKMTVRAVREPGMRELAQAIVDEVNSTLQRELSKLRESITFRHDGLP